MYIYKTGNNETTILSGKKTSKKGRQTKYLCVYFVQRRIILIITT